MPKEKGLQYYPIALFASVMGFAGLTIASKHAENIFGWNHWVWAVFLTITSLLFILNGSILIYRLIRFKPMVQNEFHHPVKMNFFGTIPISLLLLAVSYFEISQSVSFILWFAGAILQISLTLAIMSNLIFKHAFEITHFNAAWFIPIVGNIIVPIAGVNFIPKDVNWVFFSIGVLFSIIYLTFFFNRVFFHPASPQMLLPTFFILLAPPAIGFVSYIKMSGAVDAFAYILYGTAFFIGLLLVVQWQRFIQLPFMVSFWAFLFPSAAMTVATGELFVATNLTAYQILFVIQFIALVLLGFYLLVKTIQLAFTGKLCLKD
ncbi:MAG TPA: SLAC1 anion channel family protein [Pseudogracilibacillus sp.]|nr:SLAC1 anion channel family protein [Pseudogracilibacillus sp.]